MRGAIVHQTMMHVGVMLTKDFVLLGEAKK